MSSAPATGSATFKDDVLNVKDTPILVDFWAPWCGPCQQQGPILDDFAKEMTGKVKVLKVNVDDEGDLSSKYGIMSIPALKIFKNGEVVDEMVGVHSKKQLIAAVEKHA